eukprot:3712761-Prymnesium_polylepis.1
MHVGQLATMYVGQLATGGGASTELGHGTPHSKQNLAFCGSVSPHAPHCLCVGGAASWSSAVAGQSSICLLYTSDAARRYA